MKKENKVLLGIGIVLAVLIFYQNNLFEIYTPRIYDSSLASIINKYYFPTMPYSSKVVSFACDNSKAILATTFSSTITSTPYSTSNRIFTNGKYYQYKNKVVVKSGTCSNLGKVLLVDGANPLKNFIIIQVGKDYDICKNYRWGGYEYARFIEAPTCTSSSCKMSYYFPNQEKYTCDQLTGKIYKQVCGSTTRTLMETCQATTYSQSLAGGGNMIPYRCTTEVENVDTGSVPVVKCAFNYKPSKRVCASNGLALYTTDADGTLNAKACTKCSNGFCTPPLTPPKKSCTLVAGTGKGSIDVFVYNPYFIQGWEQWIYSELKNQTPYNEFSYNVYHESEKGACNGIVKMNSRDVRIGVDYADGHIGVTHMSSPGVPGTVIFDLIACKDVFWHFLLFHELGHAYTHAGHTNDGSIMDANGGNGKYTQAEINTIRKYLNDTRDG